jgi:hypothetical protein
MEPGVMMMRWRSEERQPATGMVTLVRCAGTVDEATITAASNPAAAHP